MIFFGGLLGDLQLIELVALIALLGSRPIAKVTRSGQDIRSLNPLLSLGPLTLCILWSAIARRVSNQEGGRSDEAVWRMGEKGKFSRWRSSRFEFHAFRKLSTASSITGIIPAESLQPVKSSRNAPKYSPVSLTDFCKWLYDSARGRSVAMLLSLGSGIEQRLF